jgi:hypothetical protein
MDWPLVVSGASFALNALVIGFWKPWLAAYGGEKGKNLARKEDLDAILAEVRAVTITQREIESKIAGELWNKQLITNQKKDLYADILRLLHEFMKESNGLCNLLLFRQRQAAGHGLVDDVDVKITESQVLLAKANQEVLRLMGLAAIFADAECVMILGAFMTGFDKPETVTIEWARAETLRTAEANAQIVRVAR